MEQCSKVNETIAQKWMKQYLKVIEIMLKSEWNNAQKQE